MRFGNKAFRSWWWPQFDPTGSSDGSRRAVAAMLGHRHVPGIKDYVNAVKVCWHKLWALALVCYLPQCPWIIWIAYLDIGVISCVCVSQKRSFRDWSHYVGIIWDPPSSHVSSQVMRPLSTPKRRLDEMRCLHRSITISFKDNCHHWRLCPPQFHPFSVCIYIYILYIYILYIYILYIYNVHDISQFVHITSPICHDWWSPAPTSCCFVRLKRWRRSSRTTCAAPLAMRGDGDWWGWPLVLVATLKGKVVPSGKRQQTTMENNNFLWVNPP